MTKNKPKINVIVGPTAVGKTNFATFLAVLNDAVVLSVDAYAIYREMDIGTAKPGVKELECAHHYMIDVVNPNEDYNIKKFQQDARFVLDDLLRQGKNVIIVGGSGLYLKALLYDYDFKEEKRHDYLYDMELDELVKMCPEFEGDKKNKRRVIRYLERKLNNNLVNKKPKKLYDFEIMGLTCDKEQLHKNIETRVDQMVENGLFDEVKELYDKYRDCNALNSAIGYKEVIEYIKGNISKEEAISLIKKNTKKLAKKQYTFFKNQFDDINWSNTGAIDTGLAIE